jgi:sugar phosphate isomerase/epimerase
MIFGYSTNAFIRFSLEDAVEKIASLGFSGVEIMGDRPHLYPPDYNEDAVSALKAHLRNHRLTVTNLNSFTLFAVGDTYLPSWIEPEETRRNIRIRHTLDCLKIASAMGCKNISIPPGGPVGPLSRKAAMALFYSGLEAVIPTAESLNVKLLVEPEPGLLIENSREFEAFISEIRSLSVGINFDIGHFFCAGELPEEAFETLFEWVGHVHLEDIARSRIHRHLIPGHGAIGFGRILKTMARLGYRGAVSLELYPYTDTPEEAGRESLAYLKPLFDAAGIVLES